MSGDYVKLSDVYELIKNFGQEEAVHKLSDLSTIEIVCCKDCKFSTMTYDGECAYCDIWFPDEKIYLDGDYYCESGERKEKRL